MNINTAKSIFIPIVLLLGSWFSTSQSTVTQFNNNCYLIQSWQSGYLDYNPIPITGSTQLENRQNYSNGGYPH